MRADFPLEEMRLTEIGRRARTRRRRRGGGPIPVPRRVRGGSSSTRTPTGRANRPRAGTGATRVSVRVGVRCRVVSGVVLGDVFGIPDVADRIVTEKMVTPADWRSERINLGATFNLAHGLDQMLHRRPQHRLEDVDGVWMVGGGTHPGSGLPVIFLSSQITADLLCQEHGLRETPAWSPMATIDAS